MFGYITPNLCLLNDDQKARFRAAYCGLCRTLRLRHGLGSTLTLSNDLTFLALLLSALYEPTESEGTERCVPHPFRKHSYFTSDVFNYAADMNVALAYYKFLDNWKDDKNVLSAAEAAWLKRGYARVSAEHPEKCSAVEQWIRHIHIIESSGCTEIDIPVNSTGQMLGTLFCWQDDIWSDSLRTIGDALGRFVYLMDAYDDLEKDIRSNSFNPLKQFSGRNDFEKMCKDALTMAIADCTVEFETLPVIQDADLLRNVLYSGVWSRYAQIQKRKGSKGAE